MYKVAIVDDQRVITTITSEYLSLFKKDIKVIWTAEDVNTAYNQLTKNVPDLLLLDINLGSNTGFDLLDRFTEIDFKVVFITSYDEYAIKAFRYDAFDYILKPINQAEINRIITKFLNSQAKAQDPSKTEKTERHNLKKIAVPNMEGAYLVDIDDIIRCKSENSYTHIYTSSGKVYISSKPLKEYDDSLPKSIFFRVHKSHLINLNYITKYIKNNHGGIVVMSDEQVIEVARRRRDEFLTLIKN